MSRVKTFASRFSPWLNAAYLTVVGALILVMSPETALAASGSSASGNSGLWQQISSCASHVNNASQSTPTSNPATGELNNLVTIITNGVTLVVFLAMIIFIGYAAVVAVKYFGASDDRKMAVASQNLRGLLIGAGVLAGAFLIRSIAFGIVCGNTLGG